MSNLAVDLPNHPVYLPEWPPTQDELPYDDGEPMESWRHKCQTDLLISTTHAERGFEAVPSEVGG